MHIQEATIHRLIKAAQTKGIGAAKQQLRGDLLPVDQTLITVCTDLLALYSTVANSNGTLGQDATLHTFPIRLNDYIEQTIDFNVFSTVTLSLIKSKMEESIFANGGYALFLRYSEGNSDFLLVAMLKLKPGAGIDEDSLSLEPTLNIDLGLLHEAARINLTRLSSDTQPYLTFIKGRKQKGDVTEYFRTALACENFTSSRHHTEQVIKAANAFADSRQDLSTPQEKYSEKIDMRRRLHTCFASNSQEVVLDTLAAAIMPRQPSDFVNFVRTGPSASEYQINDAFKPHRSSYRKLYRITGAIGTISVGFDVSDVQAQRVYYDANIDALIIKSPTDSLKQAVLENAASS
jgi:nucleoid-associated protein